MKTSMVLILLGLSLVACKGKDGERGAAGLPGAPGSSFSTHMVNRNGPVTSDTIAVTVPGLSIERGDLLNVYVCVYTACEPLNLYQAGTGNNMYYIVSGSVVTIYYALTGRQTLWYISALEKL